MTHLTYLSVGVVKMMQYFRFILNYFHSDLWQVVLLLFLLFSFSLKTRIQMYSCRRPKPSKSKKKNDRWNKPGQEIGVGMEAGVCCRSFGLFKQLKWEKSRRENKYGYRVWTPQWHFMSRCNTGNKPRPTNYKCVKNPAGGKEPPWMA